MDVVRLSYTSLSHMPTRTLHREVEREAGEQPHPSLTPRQTPLSTNKHTTWRREGEPFACGHTHSRVRRSRPQPRPTTALPTTLPRHKKWCLPRLSVTVQLEGAAAAAVGSPLPRPFSEPSLPQVALNEAAPLGNAPLVAMVSGYPLRSTPPPLSPLLSDLLSPLCPLPPPFSPPRCRPSTTHHTPREPLCQVMCGTLSAGGGAEHSFTSTAFVAASPEPSQSSCRRRAAREPGPHRPVHAAASAAVARVA